MSASRSETARPPGPDEPESGAAGAVGPDSGPGADLLAALLDGMDAALCAFDADGVITHWNREAERILGWSAEEAVGGADSPAGPCAAPTPTRCTGG